MNARNKTSIAAVLVLSGHGLFVEWRNSIKKLEPSFKTGSADEILVQSAQTGDIIMFSRTWYKYHIPVSFMIYTYKYIFNAEFDHGGIIITDTVGVPRVLENTPFGGLKFRPLEERIRHSDSAHIVVIPLENSSPLTADQTQKLKQYASDQLGSNARPCELLGCVMGLSCYVWAKLGLNNDSNSSVNSKVGYCDGTNLILGAFQAADISISSTESITLNTIHNRSIALHSASNTISLAKNDINLRSN